MTKPAVAGKDDGTRLGGTDEQDVGPDGRQERGKKARHGRHASTGPKDKA
jgi:hypothetical protein